MGGKFEAIQYLRAFAALAVVLHHVISPRAWLYNPVQGFEAGQAGVDIFFVISGFIIYLAARDQHPVAFVARRIVRIVPLYWLATAVSLASVLRQGVLNLDDGFKAHLIKSLLFIPTYNLAVPDEIWPLFVPGWTLQYEMFFYAVFAVGLALRRTILVVTAVLAGLVVAGLFVRSTDPRWVTYTDPLLLEFLAGLCIARYRRALTSRWLAVLIPLGILGLVLSGLVTAPRLVRFGIPAVAIVIGAVAAESTGRLARLPWLSKVGDASYSIYLSQFVTIELAVRLVRPLPLHGPIQFLAMIGAALVTSIAIGMTVHQFLERPITRRLSRRRPGGALEVQAAP